MFNDCEDMLKNVILSGIFNQIHCKRCFSFDNTFEALNYEHDLPEVQLIKFEVKNKANFLNNFGHMLAI